MWGSLRLAPIIAGDFNVDFTRKSSNGNHLLHFMHNHNLVSVDSSANITYTYRRDNFSAFSWPDHILTYSHISHMINNILCAENADNFSDHLPLFFQFVVSHPLSLPTLAPPSSIYSNSTQHPSHTPTVNWDRVTDSDISAYCTYIRDQLPIISEGLLNCCDPGCTNHYENIDSICSSLLHTLKVGAERCLPLTHFGLSRGSRIPGWNRKANKLRESVRFWHQLWTDSGCPSSGVLLQIKRIAKLT